MLPLSRLREVGASRPTHATVNDVLLAVIAGGLRSWLSAHGTSAGRLRAQVPVSLHHRDESAHELGNRDSFLNVDLPLAEPDPVLRLDLIRAETARRKQLGDADDDVGVGMCTDPSALPGVGDLADQVEAAFTELAAAALS